jgi:hypothetical protein
MEVEATVGAGVWIRGIAGIIFLLIGSLWIAQGLGAAKGSAMSGHPAYAVLGALAALVGIYFVYSAARVAKGE